jgi:phage terminase large subunit-like protein
VASSAASRQSRSRPSPKRLGSETPRVWTKPLRKLTPKTSLGYSVIEFAETVLEIELLPWQKWLLIHMLELLPDNSLRFRTVIVLVARQNGKSTLSQIVALWFMYVYGVALVIGTAQDLDVAEEIWQGAVDLVEEVPELDDLKESVVKVNGKKALVLKKDPDLPNALGQRYKVKAANRRAGRGLSGDIILLDELREHQSWDAWGAITKTTMARSMALILALSNAGDATSIVLRYLRKMCHAALGDPDGINNDDPAAALLPGDEDDTEPLDFEIDEDDDSVAIFEWSAPPGCDIRDRDGWAQANPALGYTITERTIASACRTDPEWIFRTEVLCQWSEGTLEGPFPPDSWERSADEKSKRADGADIALCIDTSWDRSTSHIGLASRRPDGNIHVELIASRTGTEWVAEWLTDHLERSVAVLTAPVAVQAKGAPASSLIVPLREAGVNVVEWGGSNLGSGTGAFYDLVRAAVGEGSAETGVRHRNQPLLNIAAANAATKPAGDAWWWDRRKSAVDVAPLIAVTGAAWLLTSAMPEKPRDSVYESRGLVTL